MGPTEEEVLYLKENPTHCALFDELNERVKAAEGESDDIITIS